MRFLEIEIYLILLKKNFFGKVFVDLCFKILCYFVNEGSWDRIVDKVDVSFRLEIFRLLICIVFYIVFVYLKVFWSFLELFVV